DLAAARAWWAAGYTGAGVDVAVVDSGVARVGALAEPGRVLDGGDFRRGDPGAAHDGDPPGGGYGDGYGHGTFMAGLIAGRDPLGLAMAPDARIVAVPVGDEEGDADRAEVAAAIRWAAAHGREHGLNVRVLNLSYAAPPLPLGAPDPLLEAVEEAHRAGILVVAAVGNTGEAGPGLASPALSRAALAVGATRTAGGPSPLDDERAEFSARGAGCVGCRTPDLLAPGAHLRSWRAPGAVVDRRHPEGRDRDPRLFRGSGTSQAAAVTSGAAALVLSRWPHLSPDEVKAYLLAHAQPLPDLDATAQGAGALLLPPPHDDGGAVWSGARWSGTRWSGTRWSGTRWSGTRWSGTRWSGTRWS
ncbi:MAG: S8 family serine peptidase, partial [Acidimicrobiales bacterium]